MKWLLCLWVASPLLGHPGWGLVEDHQGNLFVGDVIRNLVWRIAPDGAVRAVAQGRHAHALCLDGEGVVWGEHTDYNPSTLKFSRSRWRLDGEQAVKAPGGCDSLELGRPHVDAAAPRDGDWEIYVAIPRKGGWVLLEHATLAVFEARLKRKEAVTRVRRVDASGAWRILLLR